MSSKLHVLQSAQRKGRRSNWRLTADMHTSANEHLRSLPNTSNPSQEASIVWSQKLFLIAPIPLLHTLDVGPRSVDSLLCLSQYQEDEEENGKDENIDDESRQKLRNAGRALACTTNAVVLVFQRRATQKRAAEQPQRIHDGLRKRR